MADRSLGAALAKLQARLEGEPDAANLHSVPVWQLRALIEAAKAPPAGRSILACVFAGLLALFVAKALGVPFWRDGWGLDIIGDQVDFMLTAAMFAWFIQPGGRRHGR